MLEVAIRLWLGSCLAKQAQGRQIDRAWSDNGDQLEARARVNLLV